MKLAQYLLCRALFRSCALQFSHPYSAPQLSKSLAIPSWQSRSPSSLLLPFLAGWCAGPLPSTPLWKGGCHETTMPASSRLSGTLSRKQKPSRQLLPRTEKGSKLAVGSLHLTAHRVPRFEDSKFQAALNVPRFQGGVGLEANCAPLLLQTAAFGCWALD